MSRHSARTPSLPDGLGPVVAGKTGTAGRIGGVA